MCGNLISKGGGEIEDSEEDARGVRKLPFSIEFDLAGLKKKEEIFRLSCIKFSTAKLLKQVQLTEPAERVLFSIEYLHVSFIRETADTFSESTVFCRTS